MLKNSGKLVMGDDTFVVDVELFALNRTRLVERLRSKKVPKGSVVLLQGGKDVPFNDTDVNYTFRQESYFMWAFGVLEPDCYGAISVDTGESYLFIPRLPSSYAIIMGPIPEPKDALQKYKVHHAHYVDELLTVLKSLHPCSLLVVHGINTDSDLESVPVVFDGMKEFTINKELLFNEIADLRVVKTKLEIEVIRHVVKISSAAHRKVMRMAKPGRTEYQCESEFLHYCYSVGGCRNVSYTCISASGCNSGYLHYGHAAAPNDRTIRDGDLCLFDMGANYFGYCSDITCSFPSNGKFTDDQKFVYESVLAANRAVEEKAKPGVNWLDLHIVAATVLLEKLKKGGLLQGEVNDMVKDGLAFVFFPHGLGHLMGLDVHDVGGYLPDNPPRLTQPAGVEKLRTSRDLLEGMVITNEPGCYFIDHLIDGAYKNPTLSKYLIPDVVNRFKGMGGVRIEDDILITATGCENLTKVPRSVQEIEDWIAGKDDDKY